MKHQPPPKQSLTDMAVQDMVEGAVDLLRCLADEGQPWAVELLRSLAAQNDDRASTEQPAGTQAGEAKALPGKKPPRMVRRRRRRRLTPPGGPPRR